MTVTVKQGDIHATTWTVNMDLTGATVRLLCRSRKTKVTEVLPSTVPNPAGGVVQHMLSGTLAAGEYDIEVEAVTGGLKVTFPNGKYETLKVVPDLG